MALAVLIGLSLGVLGSGGSILTLPVLVYIGGVPANEAVGMSMAIVGATSLFGAAAQLRRGNVSLKAALLFAAAGMGGAFAGSTGTHLLPKKVLLLLFAGLMLIVGSLMLRERRKPRPQTVCSIARCLGVGLGVGVVTGFLGVGGGFLIVPALVFSAGLDIRKAGGTSLAVIAMNSAAGLIGQLRYVQIDWSLLGGFLLFASGGMAAGLAFAKHVHDRLLRRVFALALIVLGVVIGAMNL